jgi:uncharacterized protein YecE (DUF72 family)
MTLKMGCAIWAYKGWVGPLFPKGSSPSKFLQLYSQRFSTVECNATFYSIPSAEVVTRWAQETPSTFEFCPKLPRSITHEGVLQPKIGAALRFIELMQRLGSERLGPIFIQLPPRYGPQAFQDLQEFLQGVRGGGTDLAVEARHPQWFQDGYGDRLNDLLTRLEIGRVLLDSRPIYECPDDPQLASERRKPRLPLQPASTSSFGFIRYISHPDTDFNEQFMMSWIPHINDWLSQGKRIYLFVHCPTEERSPQNAQRFQSLLEKHLDSPIPPLPWSQIRPESTQLSLFSSHSSSTC